MRVVLKDLLKILLIIIILTFTIVSPLKVEAKEATTLKELKTELKNLQNQKKKNESSTATKKSEIKSKTDAIANAEQDIKKAENDIDESRSIIAQSKDEIEKVQKQTEELLRYMQIMSSDNAYLEYATGASSVTDLIMRLSSYEQITDYTTNQLEELELLIDTNEKEQVRLSKLQQELDKKIENYESRIVSLGDDINELAEITDSIDEQIKNQKNLIEFYEQSGCKDNDLLAVCATSLNNASWKKPTAKGRISSDYGWRTNPLKNNGTKSFHNGIDIAGNSEGTNVYAVGNGKIAAITYRSSCGGNKVYMHLMVNQKKYTVSYVHLLSVNVKVGDVVNFNTVIGRVGGYSTAKRNGGYDTCTTGAHLHFGVSNGYYLEDYSSYSTFSAKGIRPPNFPSKGSWFYSR